MTIERSQAGLTSKIFMMSLPKLPDRFSYRGSWLLARQIYCLSGKRSCVIATSMLSSFVSTRFQGSPTEPLHQDYVRAAGGTVYWQWHTNLCHCNCRQWVVPIWRESIGASTQFDDASIDAIYIDGDHRYEAVKNDIKAWLPKVKPGGIVAGHDYGWDGVKKAVDEIFGDQVQQMKNSTWRVDV